MMVEQKKSFRNLVNSVAADVSFSSGSELRCLANKAYRKKWESSERQDFEKALREMIHSVMMSAWLCGSAHCEKVHDEINAYASGHYTYDEVQKIREGDKQYWYNKGLDDGVAKGIEKQRKAGGFYKEMEKFQSAFCSAFDQVNKSIKE